MQEEVKNRVLAEADYIVVYHTTLEKISPNIRLSKLE